MKMKSRLTKTTLSITIGTLLALAPGAFAGERAPEAKQIAQLAQKANSPTDHENVAKMYVQHSRSLEEKADKIEQELRNQPKSPMEVKWPAMVVNARERKERLAMQARRAAQESMRLAEHHGKLAGRSLEDITAVD